MWVILLFETLNINFFHSNTRKESVKRKVTIKKWLIVTYEQSEKLSWKTLMHFEHWSAGYNNCVVTRYSCSAAESCGFGVVYPSVLTLVRWVHTAWAELFSLHAGKGWAHTTSPSHFPPGSAAMVFLHPLFLNNGTHSNKATDFNKCLWGFCCWTFLFWLFDEKLFARQWRFQIVVRSI